jgi:hypothetical protein
MKTEPSTTNSGACAVVLEPESIWPARAFAATPDRDCVMVMPAETELSAAAFVDRFMTNSTEFGRSGTRLRTIILACGGGDGESNTRRGELVKALLPLLTPKGGRLVLTNDSSAGPSNDELLEFIGTMLGELRGTSVTFVANDQVVVPVEPAAPMDSGIFSLGPETQGSLAPLSVVN